MRRAIYGETHPAVGVAWLNLAAALQEIEGRQDEAVRSYDVARSVLEATLGPSHPAIG